MINLSSVSPGNKLLPSEIENLRKYSNAWTLGNYQYLISAEFSVTTDKAATNKKKYACRITYNNGDNEEGAQDFNNWSIIGVSGL